MDEMIDVKMPPEPEPPQSADEPPVSDDPVEMQVEEAPEDEPEPPPREHIPDEDVFKDAPSIKKVKRKCSQKQLDHLAKCREKALAKKKEQKEFADRQKEKQRRYVEQERRANPPKPKPQPRPAPRQRQPPPPDPQIYYEEEDFPYEEPPQQNTYQGEEYPEIFHKLTASEIRAIQKDAINDYEIVRKERKHKKRMDLEQQRVEQERRKIMGMMSGRQPKIAHDEDPWSSAFSF